MNSNSFVCKFIAEHPDDWESLLENEYKVGVKKEGSYAILNYGFGQCNFSCPLVQESRGIIVDFLELEVVCWPFRKFGNYNESYCDSIDWDNARVLEKVDGSIIKLWFDNKKDKWQFSTNATIRAENAPVNNEFLDVSFGDVIKEADNYQDIPFDSLDKANTYIFELVSPKTQVVIKYPRASLYHIGTRNNLSGSELEVDIGIKKPQSFSLGSLEECINAVSELNKSSDEIEGEGFVVVDKDYHRVKIKSPDYLVMNKLKQMKCISKKDCISLIISCSDEVEIICSSNPELVPVFKYYEFKLAELKLLANKMAILARGLYKEFDMDRGAVARIISSHRLGGIGFTALENNMSGEEILMSLTQDKLLRLIDDYEPEDLRSLLKNRK